MPLFAVLVLALVVKFQAAVSWLHSLLLDRYNLAHWMSLTCSLCSVGLVLSVRVGWHIFLVLMCFVGLYIKVCGDECGMR